jgi:signal transduction histidine kinase
MQFTVVPVDPALAVDADPQLLASAVMNLLHNAFKFSRAGGSVALRVHAEGTRVLLDIEDECGGIHESQADLFQAFGERRSEDRSGLGLGLSIARQAIRAHGGDIQMRNLPGTAASSRSTFRWPRKPCWADLREGNSAFDNPCPYFQTASVSPYFYSVCKLCRCRSGLARTVEATG